MGNKSQQKKNKLIDTAGAQAAAQSKQLGGYGAEDRAYSVGARDDINSKYNALYEGLGEEGGGGGGGGEVYTPTYEDARENEALGGYRNLRDTGNADLFSEERAGYKNFADTGGFNTAQEQDFRARGNSTLPAFYSSLQDQLENQNRQSGGYNVGFNSQSAKLAREKAYGANQAVSNTEASLQDLIRQGKLSGLAGMTGIDTTVSGNKVAGLEGVGKYDTEFMDNTRRVEEQRQAANASAAAQRNANSARQRNSRDDDFRNRMAILSEQRGLRGEAGSDLPYWELQQGATGQQLGAANAREVEKSGWDKAGSIAKTVGRGVAAFYTGGLSEAGLAGLGALKKRGAGPAPSPDGYG